MTGMGLAHHIVCIVNKEIVPEQNSGKKRGRKGYGILSKIRVLVYQQAKRIPSDKGLVKHLKKNTDVRKTLRLKSVPHRTQISRWRKKYWHILKMVFEKVGDLIDNLLISTDMIIVDSTPLEDNNDQDAMWGFYSRGWFKGFKAHISVNQLCIPRRAVVTTGNRYDSPFFPDLIRDIECEYVLGDAGYDSKRNRKIARQCKMRPVIARNPRRSGNKYKTPMLLKKKRYLVEQFNSLLKELLNDSWQRWKGLPSKQGVVYAALISIQMVVISSLLEGSKHLKCIGKYWY